MIRKEAEGIQLFLRKIIDTFLSFFKNSSCERVFGCSLIEILSRIRGKNLKKIFLVTQNLIETYSNYVIFCMLIFFLGNFRFQIFTFS